MNLNTDRNRLVGVALIGLAVVMLFNLWWVLPALAFGGAGVYIYQRERQLGRVGAAVQGGLWGVGLAVLYTLGFFLPGLLVVGGASLLLKGNEQRADDRIQAVIGRVRSRNRFNAAPVSSAPPAPPAPPVTVVPTVIEDARSGETVRLR